MNKPSNKVMKAAHDAASMYGNFEVAIIDEAVEAVYQIIRAELRLEMMGDIYTEAKNRIREEVIAEIAADLRIRGAELGSGDYVQAADYIIRKFN